MNERSLSHTYIKNQCESSWNDDPFNMKGFRTGVSRVPHSRRLSDFAEELVSRYAKSQWDHYELNLDMIPEDEQNELAFLYIESTNREVNECIYGEDFSINSNFICSLLDMLKKDCEETRERFAEVTRKNTLVYFRRSLDELLTHACDSYFLNSMNEDEYRASRDMDEDVSWGAL